MHEEDPDAYNLMVERCVLHYGRNLPGVDRQALPGASQAEYQITDDEVRDIVHGGDFMKAYGYRDGCKKLPQDLVMG